MNDFDGTAFADDAVLGDPPEPPAALFERLLEVVFSGDLSADDLDASVPLELDVPVEEAAIDDHDDHLFVGLDHGAHASVEDHGTSWDDLDVHGD